MTDLSKHEFAIPLDMIASTRRAQEHIELCRPRHEVLATRSFWCEDFQHYDIDQLHSYHCPGCEAGLPLDENWRFS